MLKSKLKLLEHSLEDQRITSSYLKEERDRAVDLNRALQRELKELKCEEIARAARFSSERESTQVQSHQTGPLNEEQTLANYIFAFPRKCTLGLVKRVALFVWWTGMWVNQGLGMLRIENKWVELDGVKCELEQENARLRQQNYGLQKLLTEREFELVGEIERNKELTKRVSRKCSVVPCNCGRNHSFETVAKHVHAIADYSECLNQEIDMIKDQMEQRFAQFEKVCQDIDRLTEGQRLLEKKLNPNDCHSTSTESSMELEKEKMALLSKKVREKKPISSNEDKKLKLKKVNSELNRACGMIFYGCRNIIVFFFAFLALGFLFHFLLVSSSMRLPSIPVKEYYGVDLFALWCYFVNWIFSLLVTE